jgi:hypothetical protein
MYQQSAKPNKFASSSPGARDAEQGVYLEPPESWDVINFAAIPARRTLHSHSSGLHCIARDLNGWGKSPRG